MKKLYCLLAMLLAACLISSCTILPGKSPLESDSVTSGAGAESTHAITTEIGTTRAPETTKAPVTTKAPETTNAPDTPPEPAGEYKDHVYFIAQNSGNCTELIGTVYVNVFLVDDTVSSWSSESIAELKASFAEQEESLEADARSYGKMLDIIYVYTAVSIAVEINTDNKDKSWQNDVFSKLDLVSAASAQLLLQSKNGGDSNPIVLAVNKTGRAYAAWNTGNASERVTLYSSSLDSLRHELCHLYGARDFYYPAEAKELANKHLRDSLMNSGESVDALTAYLIGWDDELDENAKAFLEDTKHFTKEYLDEEQSKQTVTGNVTDYPLSYGIYTGYLEYGVPNGYGKLIYTGGDVYEGDFVGGRLHGKGTYRWANGNTYEGDWVNSSMSGKGTYTWSSGEIYEGDWVDGHRTGKGKFIWTTGDIYDGDWVDGERTGKGTFIWASGATYIGDYVNGVRTGKGKYIWTNGNVYEGDFVDNERSGYGVFTYASGDTYTGEWLGGKFHGNGTYHYTAGHVYVGKWVSGNRTGYGKMTWSDGSSYDGEWLNNKRHGYGKYINKNGTVFEGQWNNDVFQG